VQGTFETFAAAGRKHFGGSLEGKFVLTGGLGGMGGGANRSPHHERLQFFSGSKSIRRGSKKRLKSGYCDKIAQSLDEALKLIEKSSER